MLRQQPPSTRIDLTLADWAEQRGDHEAAKTAYNTILQREPQNEDAILGLTEVSARGNKDSARAALAKLPAAQNGEPLSINMQRRLAMAQAGLGDPAAAEKTFNAILPQAKSQQPSMESALVMRDAARFRAQNGQPQQALDTERCDGLIGHHNDPSDR